MRDLTLPFRDGICPRQPVQHELTQRLEQQRDVPLDLPLPDLKRIEPFQQSFLQTISYRGSKYSCRACSMSAFFVTPGRRAASSSL